MGARRKTTPPFSYRYIQRPAFRRGRLQAGLRRCKTVRRRQRRGGLCRRIFKKSAAARGLAVPGGFLHRIICFLPAPLFAAAVQFIAQASRFFLFLLLFSAALLALQLFLLVKMADLDAGALHQLFHPRDHPVDLRLVPAFAKRRRHPQACQPAHSFPRDLLHVKPRPRVGQLCRKLPDLIVRQRGFRFSPGAAGGRPRAGRLARQEVLQALLCAGRLLFLPGRSCLICVLMTACLPDSCYDPHRRRSLLHKIRSHF